MKYVITGGAGHISKPLAEQLLAAGHQVTVIGRSAENLKPLTDKGAQAAVGSVEDEAFMKQTLQGADAAYLMIPPNFDPQGGWRPYQNQVADVYIAAVKASGIKHLVVLSSVGAHMGEGAGPVDGLADFEKKLSALTEVNIKILRPSYFMYNLYSMIPLIKNMNIMGSNFGAPDKKMVLVHTDDIAATAAEELLGLKFSGHSVRYIASDEKTSDEVAKILSEAAGKPGTPWVQFSDDQAKGGMLQAGLPEPIAKGYTQLGKAMREGIAEADYWQNRPQLGKTKLEDFAKAFGGAFAAS